MNPQRSGSIAVHPNPASPEAGTGRAAVTVVWASAGALEVEVRVNDPGGDLFSRSGPCGAQRTGRWVKHGTTFYLQDVSRGLPLIGEHTLAKVTVRLERIESDERARLESLAEFESTVTSLPGQPFEIADARSFLVMYDDIFGREIYKFAPASREPFIIDGGANVGVSVLYFKRLAPDARVLAFEPDPVIFEVLARNVTRCGLTDVEPVRAALTAVSGSVAFQPQDAYAGRVVPVAGPRAIPVPAARLFDYLDRPVDLLKLNVEGAECDIMVDCASRLHLVNQIALEYHSFAGQKQNLHALLGVLAESGFRIQLAPSASSEHPLVKRTAHRGIDYQAYVYAFRE